MKKIIAVILISALSASLFAACTKTAEEPETTKEATTSAVTETTTETTTQTTTELTTESTTKKAGKAFDKWNINDMAEYFKTQKVFTDDEYLGVYTDAEELPDGISAEIEYNSHDNDRINVLIFYFDKNSDNEKTDELYNKIKKDKYFEWSDGGRQQPFNALIGRFAVFYSASVDEGFVKEFEKALDRLIKDENITPEFYKKDLDLSQFKLDDDVIIVEGDD